MLAVFRVLIRVGVALCPATESWTYVLKPSCWPALFALWGKKALLGTMRAVESRNMRRRLTFPDADVKY